jgi:hypothetical protein
VRLILAVLETPLRVAVSTAVWLVVHVPAVAVKVAEVDPAGMVTDAATGSVVLLLDRDTTVPPAGAAWANVTVQVDLAPDVKLVGKHTNDDKPGAQFVTVIAPEVAEAVSGDPFAKAASGLVTVMGTVAPLVAGASATVTVASTPLLIAESVVPTATQVTEPVDGLQVSVLPAALTAAPGATATELTSPGANANVHCDPAGPVPLVLNERLSDTEPPSTAEPDERVRDDV